jgi:hypothetical protein
MIFQKVKSIFINKKHNSNYLEDLIKKNIEFYYLKFPKRNSIFQEFYNFYPNTNIKTLSVSSKAFQNYNLFRFLVKYLIFKNLLTHLTNLKMIFFCKIYGELVCM